MSSLVVEPSVAAHWSAPTSARRCALAAPTRGSYVVAPPVAGVFLNMGKGAFCSEDPEPNAYAPLKKFWTGLLDVHRPSRFLDLHPGGSGRGSQRALDLGYFGQRRVRTTVAQARVGTGQRAQRRFSLYPWPGPPMAC
jgi:hypothetical protein